MGSFISQQIDSQTNITTNLIQSQQSYCGAVTGVNVSGTTIVVDGGKVGDIKAVDISGISADASCMMSNNMESQVEQVLQSTLNQTTSTESDLFSLLEGIGIQRTKGTVTNEIANNLSQYVQATCNANTSVDVSNTYVYVGGSGASAGTVQGVQITGITANSSCAMTNLSKMMQYQQLITDFDQKNSKKGTLGTIFGIVGIFIFLIIGIVVILAIVMIFKGGKKKDSGIDIETIAAFKGASLETLGAA